MPWVVDMPVELGLERIAIIGSDFPDPGEELLDGMIDKVDRVGLGVLVVDLSALTRVASSTAVY